MGNFNWNLVAFKRRDEVKEGKLYYFVGSLENPFFRKWGGGGSHKKQYIYRGDLPKRRAWRICRFKREGMAKESNALYADY